jgi:hypothetical protein
MEDSRVVELAYDTECTPIVKNSTTTFDFSANAKLPTQTIPTCGSAVSGSGNTTATTSAAGRPTTSVGAAASGGGLGLAPASSTITPVRDSSAGTLRVALALQVAALCVFRLL